MFVAQQVIHSPCNCIILVHNEIPSAVRFIDGLCVPACMKGRQGEKGNEFQHQRAGVH